MKSVKQAGPGRAGPDVHRSVAVVHELVLGHEFIIQHAR